ncbi:CRISPR-associated endonuclease Cas1 [Pontibacter qinzhouensis]|uniref:CRISPR-associated endonuclease Cas1 n=1 Tax=Pontibacter qinzhouensis TaxID=2603253 RepID=A0A5C8J8P4_9BACT|nr:CRISPR-associated endonuclease Cas1 [Pontibacter qinzhouensis]TXK33287.1 CRISPR-associated endonuclease Cas1 [Pontibacter qinzhouensis]
MQLYINTYGTYVHIKDEMFEVRIKEKETNDVKKHHFAASKVTSIIMTTGAALSTDAIRLAIINNVDIVFTEKDGQPLGRVWHSKLGSTTKIRKRQLEASLNGIGVQWTKAWLLTKLENQRDFIQDLKKHRAPQVDYLNDKITRLEALAISISTLQADCVADIADTLRGLEGTAGRLYFGTLSYVLTREHQFSGRSSRPAKDAFNAFLNYAFGILYSKIEKALIIAGLDPYLGFLHRDDYNQLSFVYDFIEPYRIYAETVVFRLFSGKKVNRIHTDQITNGYSLNSEGKALLVAAFNKYFDEETIRYKGKNQTRSNSIQYDAHTFANILIEKV